MKPFRPCWVLIALALSFGTGQEVRLELGFNGEIVTGRWNPLRLTTRDVPRADLVLSLDQSTLRDGEKLAVYRFPVGASGLGVFEDEVFIPTWRSFVWRLETGERVVASGSVERARLDDRPLNLLLTATPGRWRDSYSADQRVVDFPASLLPNTLAAYDGVASLLIDGSAPLPDLEALVSAVSAGATVLLVTPLPSSHDPLQALITTDPAGLGLGAVRTTDEAGVARALSQLPTPERYVTALFTPDLVYSPPTPPQLTLLLLLGGYSLFTLFLLRFGGSPGLVTSVALALLASVAAWSYLRPAEAQTVQGRTLYTGGGELARREGIRSIFSLSREVLHMPFRAYARVPVPFEQTADTLDLPLGRWAQADLILRPELSSARLLWEGPTLVNRGETPLEDVYITGFGPQADLLPGARLTPTGGEEKALPEVYLELLKLLPEGAAIARTGGTFHVALPPQAEAFDAGLRP